MIPEVRIRRFPHPIFFGHHPWLLLIVVIVIVTVVYFQRQGKK